MNKKDIAFFRKQFKPNNDLLKLQDIFNVYIRKDSKEIFHHESKPFELLEGEEQQLFMNNFKKVLGGKLDEKLFELKFIRDVENSSQLILHEGLISEDVDDWKEQMLLLVEKMLNVKQYEMDIVVTFLRGEYLKPIKPESEETDESDRDKVYNHSFIMCSINKTQEPKKELLFDYIEKEFKYNVVVDPIINLNKPISGFLFPCFTNGYADVNHVLYAAGKTNEPDYTFWESVLNVEEKLTAKEDKIVFEEIVKKVTGEHMTTSTLSNVYEEINRVIEESDDEEEPTLDYKDVERVLTASGIKNVDTEKVETAFQRVIDDEKYEIKATNIVPKFDAKSIKIETKVANVKVSPQDLKYVKKVNFEGKRYLIIEVEEDTVIDGFTMIPEVLFGTQREEK